MSLSRWTAVLSALTLGASVLGSNVAAQSTTNVPTGDRTYEELAVLRAAGLTPALIVGQRPYSRRAVAGVISDARSRLAGPADSIVSSPGSSTRGSRLVEREREALERLERWFWEEIQGLCGPGNDGQDWRGGPDEECPDPGPTMRPRVLRADATQLQSPWRAIPTRYDLPGDKIDGRINPLVAGRLGREFSDGWTTGLEGGAEFRLGRYAAGYVHPRVWVADPRGAGSGVELTLHQAYLRSVMGNLALEFGRDHVFFGQGFHAGSVISHNPRAFDMLRVSNDRPFHLPWVLDVLGPASLSFLGANLGSNRDIEHALMFLIKGSVRPHPNLELGVTSLSVQGGEGAPRASTWERMREVLLPFVWFPEFSERMAGMEVRWTLPDPGVELYVDFAITDRDWRRLEQTATDEAVWLVGAAIPSWGPGGRLSLRTEWARNGFRPYTHHQFTSGLTLDELVIGSPLGPAASGVSGFLGWSGTNHQLDFSASWERYVGDTWENIPTPDNPVLYWQKTADNPDEVRLRLQGEWSRIGFRDDLRPSVRVGWESVDRFDWGAAGRTNWLLAATLEYRW